MNLKLALVVLSFICIHAGCAYGKPPRTCPNFPCETSADCHRSGRDCDRCILNGYGQLVCGNGPDCRAVRCAGCPQGQCGPISQDSCCQDTSQCSSSGCCDSLCFEDSDCKDGPCRGCIINGVGSQVCGDPSKDCSKTTCFTSCPPGECAPRNPNECCDNVSLCSREGCCGAKCDTNDDCTPGPCGTCIVNGLGDRVCGQAEKDCSRVRCFAICPPGTCAPRTEDTCCDDIGKCDAIGCCGYKCNGDSDCKKGECRKCILNGLGRNVCGRKDKDCSNVKCLARCPPGTCSPRTEETCCDDLNKCSSKNCRDDGIDFGDCAVVSCLACPRGQCAPLDGCCPDLQQCSAKNCPDDGIDFGNCAAVSCLACPPGQCAPLDGCCPDLRKCSANNCDLLICPAVACPICPPGQCAPRDDRGCCTGENQCSPANC